VQLYLGVRELGVIPHNEVPARRLRRSDPRGLLSAPEPVHGTELVTMYGARSIVSDSFRAVLASILFCGENGSRPRVIVLTSAGPGEGKTTLASNLAISLAQVNRKVLLIDADLRRPRLHEIFGMENTAGLVDLLRQNDPAEGGTGLPFVKKMACPPLDLLTAGSAEPAEADLLFSVAMPGLIARCRTQYDMVIIDTPPMLHMADARLLGKIADAAVLVARAGYTTRDAGRAAYERLANDRTRVLGMVLNDWNPKRSSSAYYARKHYRELYTSTAAHSRDTAASVESYGPTRTHG
jgi:capsular exopolysaccharide synthesis family protein